MTPSRSMVDISRGQNSGFRWERQRRRRGGEEGQEWLEDFIGGVNASPARILIKSNSRLRKLATGSTVKWNNVGRTRPRSCPLPFFRHLSSRRRRHRRCEMRRIHITTAHTMTVAVTKVMYIHLHVSSTRRDNSSRPSSLRIAAPVISPDSAL